MTTRSEARPRHLLEPGPTGAAQAGDSDSSRLAMILLLASLGMLFAAALVGHLVIRLRLPEWPPAGSPPLPVGLWPATMILMAVSGALVAAERAAACSRPHRLQRWLWLAFVGGAGFVLLQIWNWSVLAAAVAAVGQNMFTATYWVLTVLHGLHVVGGLVPLVVLALRAGDGRYGAGNRRPVSNIAWYWHFLGVTWLAIVAALVV